MRRHGSRVPLPSGFFEVVGSDRVRVSYFACFVDLVTATQTTPPRPIHCHTTTPHHTTPPHHHHTTPPPLHRHVVTPVSPSGAPGCEVPQENAKQRRGRRGASIRQVRPHTRREAPEPKLPNQTTTIHETISPSSPPCPHAPLSALRNVTPLDRPLKPRAQGPTINGR